MKSSKTTNPTTTQTTPPPATRATAAAGAAEYVNLARIARPQGRRGEVAADILTDFPELFAERQKLFLQMASGPPRAAILESHWLHKGRIVFKFAGIDSIEDAETLAGAFVQIPLAERAQVPQGAYYIRDLVGCRLFDSEQEVGTVSDVAFGAGTAPLLKVTAGEQNFEIPFADAYVKHLDLAAREIRTELPQGLLEINRRPETAKKKPEPKPEAKPGKP